MDDVVSLAKASEHVCHDFRRILQIGVHDHDRIAPRVVEAGGDRELVPEIAGKRNEPIT